MDQYRYESWEKCRGGKLLVVATVSSGFEMRETYRCTQCHSILIKRASFDVNKNVNTKGQTSSDLNLSMAVGMYCSATNATKMNEMCSMVGITSPSLNGMNKNNRMLKHQIFDFSIEQLTKNRTDHVVACRKLTHYTGDIVFTKDKVLRKVARGKIAIDGAGNVRAYNHLIRGNQHCLVVFSLEINKPLLVIGHQTSCYKCSRTLTKMMSEQHVPMNKIQYQSIKHKGVCYRNTTAGPAIAEELACIEAAELLLTDTDGNLLDDSQAIFCDTVVSDGDTRGSLKLIARQAEIIGNEAKNIAEQIPDIGHFIKCISNGFYTIKTKNKEFSGVGLLEPQRIRSISADVSRHLRDYHRVSSNGNLNAQSINDQKLVYLARISSIVPHHCGNHEYCNKKHCQYKLLEFITEPGLKLCNPNYSPEDLRSSVNEKYACVSRFCGKTMDISTNGQMALTKVIQSRLNVDNIDRLASILSSNCCEQYFGILVKYSQGKRLNLDKTDS